MDELVALFEDVVKMIPLDKLEPEFAKVIRDSLVARVRPAVTRLLEHVETIAKPYVTPAAGAPVDEDLPPSPAHWAKEAPGPVDNAPPPPTVAPGQAPADQVDMETKLAALAPAPAELPSTTIADQIAYAQAQQQAPAPEAAAPAGAQG